MPAFASSVNGLCGRIGVCFDNNPIELIDVSDLNTSTCDRKNWSGGQLMLGFMLTFSHTFTFTANPDGTIKHTYSWGNSPNPYGWHRDRPGDLTAAEEALRFYYEYKEGDSRLDQSVANVHNALNTKKSEHYNLEIRHNCETEKCKSLRKSKDKSKAYCVANFIGRGHNCEKRD